ncbi:hypothetical protein ES707_06543 [subsurface metagenome]
MALNRLSNDNPLHALESSLASKGYPEDAKLFLDTLFGEFTNCYVEVRLIRGKSVLQFFYPSISAVQWGLIKGKNSEGYNCYFGVCLRKTQKGDKLSVASISALWGDLDGKDFSGGKSEALAQLQELPPYLFPSGIVDTGHGYHPYWLLREAELIESPQDILRLEAYMKGLALTLHGDSTSDLSRVLRIPGLVNQKDTKNPCLCHIIHWQPERRFTPIDFDDYRAEIREAPEGKGRTEGAEKWPQHSDEENKLAVEKLLENCAFIQHCSSDAVNLSETHWWSEGQILSFFGEPGREKYHELSSPYHTDHSAYTEKETNDKFDEAIKAGNKGIAPHRCNTIQQTHGFDCPEDCLAKKMKIKSPAGLARVLVKREKSSKYLIIKTNAKGEVTSITVDRKLLIDDLKHEFTFMSVFGFVRDDILVYENGVYTFNGEKLIREECETRVPPPSLTTHICHEIRDRIAGTTFAERERFNTEKYIINLENGLLDVKTRKLIPHTPTFLSTVRIPITYDPQAKCPKIQEFLGDILRQEDVNVILEFFGYILIPDYSIPIVLLLLGEGSNGKTQLLRLLGQFIGRGNYVSVSLQDIENNSFAVASLEGKLLNMQGDLSSRWLSGIGMLKQLSGQDPITANRKYRDPLHFDNVARLVFASNKPPIIEEDTLAVWRRILPLDLPNTFEGEKDIKNYIQTILTPQELSGLLNLALEGLQQLLNKGDFSYQGSYSDRSRQYTIASDPARAFVEERCDVGAEFKILKEELYEAYKVFCDEHRVQLSGDSQFAKELRQVPGLSINDHQYQKDGVRVRWWLRIQLKEERGNGGVRGVSPENTPDYPQEKCPTCGGEEFYLTKDGQYLCSHCRPEPREIDMEV